MLDLKRIQENKKTLQEQLEELEQEKEIEVLEEENNNESKWCSSIQWKS